ncbi:hypothetical protein FRC02_003785 [Tulasnella sp. 418]|nr:hypothetical protein FRC02_003785 [Tulasnella sp. 418]
MKDRKLAWDHYENARTDQATALFEGRSNVVQWDLWRSVLRIFRNRNVEFIVSPYVAWAQLIYLLRHPKAYVHSIFAPTDALLFPNMDRIITSFDLTSTHPTFTFVQKRNILNELGLSEELFLDAGILAGFEHSPPFPPVANVNTFKEVVDLLKQHKNGMATVQAHSEAPQVKQMHYAEQFARARALVKWALVLSSDGSVLSLPLALPANPNNHHHQVTAAEIPSDIHEAFSHRLPDEVYFYLSRGLVGPQGLVWLTSGQIVEPPPLDNGEANEYRRFVKEVITEPPTGPRAVALALVSTVLNTFWQQRKINGSFWFEGGGQMHQGRPVPHNSSATVQLVERVGGWLVPTAIIEEELRRQNSSTIDFALCLGATSTEPLAARTKEHGKRENKDQDKREPALSKKDEVVANVIWRFLELRGFLLQTHQHSPLARAMHRALARTGVNDKFQDPLYLFLELVRAGVMHGNLWSGKASSGGPSFGLEEEKRCMLLIMRVLSIVPLNFKPQRWSGPLSRELLVFNSFIKSLSRALRTLIEMTALNMLLQEHARRARDDLLDISLSLPFQTDVNTGFGILAKVYLDGLVTLYGKAVTDPNAEGVREAKDEALEFCDDTFEGVKYPRAEVKRGFRFWDAALEAIRSLRAEEAVLPETAEQFEAADRWLAPMRP